MTDKIIHSNTLLEQIAIETPEKLICTEIGTILQDYISAYINQYNITYFSTLSDFFEYEINKTKIN